MRQIFIMIFLVFPLTGFSEEYICSGKVGDKIQTKIYERSSDKFLYPTQNWEFEILEENNKHIMLGSMKYYSYNKSTTIFLTIIDKETNEFSERYISSSDKKGKKPIELFGNCLVRN